MMKIAYAMSVAAAYQVATNPFVLSAILILAGYFMLATAVLVVWTAANMVAIATADWRQSRIGGGRIFTCPDWLFVLGNEQEGYLPPWYVERRSSWPWWLIAFEWAWWRNKARNLPFVSWLKWLHVPKGELITTSRKLFGVDIRIRQRGWMVEVEYFTTTRFGDFGPRLDHPEEWGGVSWAFRPWGKL